MILTSIMSSRRREEPEPPDPLHRSLSEAAAGAHAVTGYMADTEHVSLSEQAAGSHAVTGNYADP